MKIIRNIAGMPHRLHFGCGSDIREGFVNLDIHIPPFCVKVAEYNPSHFGDYWIIEGNILDKPYFPPEWFTAIHANCVFEHIHLDEIPTILYTLNKMLHKDGILCIIVPDFTILARTMLENKNDITTLRRVTYEFLSPTLSGTQGDTPHKSIWTEETAKNWLGSEGFKIQSIKPYEGHWAKLCIIAKKVTNS